AAAGTRPRRAREAATDDAAAHEAAPAQASRVISTVTNSDEANGPA
ncbi:MAG: hypothetical protein QOE85_981, partial [Actinomycetota bacterium]|nr:hypothetical protein [Actinomycetota bacterium]